MTRVALVAGVFLALVPPGAGAPRVVPLSPCTLPGGIAARCGTFTVPEDRTLPLGRAISLAVAVVPARDGGTRSDPIVHLAGGPGGSAIADAPFMQSTFSQANANRDIVLVDQRGVGGSHALSCLEPTKPPTTVAAAQAYVQACLAGLNADPRQYTTAPAMDDVADVLAALGYQQVNIYGGSYGATAAQYFLVQHPGLVRTAIMDGGTLLDVPIFELWGRNGDRALRSILDRCRRATRCRAAYPRVRQEVFEVLARLKRKPVRSLGVVIDAASAEGAIQLMTRNPESAADIPLVAHEARLGDWLPLRQAVTQYGGGQPLSVMYWSIVCNEPWARWDPARTAAASRGTYLAERTALDAGAVAAICAVVPRADQPAWSATRPTTDKPILFVVGGNDPQDPAANVAGAAATMPNSRTLVVPYGGHGSVQLGCMPTLAEQFLDAASAAGLDATCLSRYRPPQFALVP